MKLYLLISFPILLFGLSNCGSASTKNEAITFEQNPPFKVVEAYYKKWVAGVKEGGSGTNIYIVLDELNADATIQNIYFKNQIVVAKRDGKESNTFIGYLSNNAQKYVVMDANILNEAQNRPPSKIPFQLEKNEAALSYTFKGEKKFYKILNLSEKEAIAYPQTNPNAHE